ncbi:CPBP family intramembrane glutamic endopeptidase [Halobaculum limi]|uniref:CPBP family intramembrane glutamic endopeptidase n=1 Tax=Halobaculum limi TaxID=3031916 RepID=UPI002406F0BC|nr:CPBP family intramembrane glutamic endopeptidase [Halobaculum sp. YSMS11]
MAYSSRWAVERGLRRFTALFALGVFGVVAAGVTAVIRADPSAGPTPERVVAVLVSSARPLALLGVAVVVGLVAAPRVGFRSRVREYVSGNQSAWRGVRSDLTRAVWYGLAVGVTLIVTAAVFTPESTLSTDGVTVATVLASLPQQVLYAGLTEELLLRWGAMALVSLVLWWALDCRYGTVPPGVAWTSIAVSALLFGLGHLPSATALYGDLSLTTAAVVVGTNSAAGVAYGWLFWRQSLEAAMVAHAVSNLVYVCASLVFVTAAATPVIIP